jgi:hypothetical protein
MLRSGSRASSLSPHLDPFLLPRSWLARFWRLCLRKRSVVSSRDSRRTLDLHLGNIAF